MRRYILLRSAILLFLLLFVTLPGIAAADSNIRQTLFKDPDKILKEAMAVKAPLYSPKAFEEGMKHYRKAESVVQKGKIPNIQKYLNKAVGYFKRSIKNSQDAALFFEKNTVAREFAIKAEAAKYDPETWKKAEQTFREAAIQLEDGDKRDAKTMSLESEVLYLRAELNSIQTQCLKDAWALIRQADDVEAQKYAPITLNKAKNLASTSAQMIEKNRYELTEAKKVAEQARYEAAHSLYLARIVAEGLKNKKSFESVLIESEASLLEIAQAIGVEIFFDSGVDVPKHQLVSAVQQLKENNNTLTQSIKEKDATIFTLRQEVGSIKKRLGKSKSINKQMQLRKQKLIRISKSFSKEEGIVLLKGKKIVIRLYGLSFSQGKAVIEPKYFSLLTRVKKVLEQFPQSKVIIEGHTDSSGSNEINKRLSNERAEAVKQYIMADGAISEKNIKALGYGESRPVASNKTREGRAKNRRIDVVIQPAVKNW